MYYTVSAHVDIICACVIILLCVFVCVSVFCVLINFVSRITEGGTLDFFLQYTHVCKTQTDYMCKCTHRAGINTVFFQAGEDINSDEF